MKEKEEKKRGGMVDQYSDDVPNTFADELVKTFCVMFEQSVPLRVRVKLEEFDEDERLENYLFRELVGSLMWLSRWTRPDISNAVRAVAVYCIASRAIHCKAALGTLEYIMELMSTVLHIRGGLWHVFCRRYSRMLTTPLRQLTGGWYQVEQLCVEVLVYVGF